MIKFLFKKSNKGFTLIEMMVAISIFSLVMLVAIGAVLSIVSANKKAQSLSSVINNLNFAFEAMTRDLRQGRDYRCDGFSGDCTDIYDDSKGNSITFFSNQVGKDVTYSLDSDTHQIVKTVDGADSYLTAPEVNIENLKFYVVGSSKTDASDYNQARILVIINGFAGVAIRDSDTDEISIKELSKFSLQTSVSQRLLDI